MSQQAGLVASIGNQSCTIPSAELTDHAKHHQVLLVVGVPPSRHVYDSNPKPICESADNSVGACYVGKYVVFFWGIRALNRTLRVGRGSLAAWT